MKNIHTLPTDKPSRLLKDLVDRTYQLKKEVSYGNRFELPLNIYITSDEEIKEGDWCYHPLLKGGSIIQSKFNNPNSTMKKIILTTDQDLIKDGVQAIDYEFLEWFVKNPSCEFVEMKLLDAEEKLWEEYYKKNSIYPKYPWYYKIIIPKEEHEQFEDEFEFQSRIINKVWDEDKQETLEEVAEILYPNYQQEIFIKGAKWQAERMYSEEEVVNILIKAYEDIGKRKIPNQVVLASWFEQFKKK